MVEHLRESAVVIVPLRIGGGTRLKIYEAMATGKAVVSTTVGAEGLDVHHGRDIMLADDARSFAQAIIMLLRDPELRRRYEQGCGGNLGALRLAGNWRAFQRSVAVGGGKKISHPVLPVSAFGGKESVKHRKGGVLQETVRKKKWEPGSGFRSEKKRNLWRLAITAT